MNDDRIPYLYVAVGTKGCGKSYMSKKSIMDNYVRPKRLHGQDKPVLIFDTNDEYQDVPDIFFDITATKPESDGRKKAVIDGKKCAEAVIDFCTKCYKGEETAHIRRVLPFKPNMEEMTIAEKQATAEILLKYFKGGLLVLEDLNAYMLGAKTKEVISAITTNRHRNQDVLIHLQSLGALDPRLWQNVNVIRMHREATDYKKLVEKIKTNPEIFQIAKYIVDGKLDTNPYSYIYVYPQTYEIYGCTEEEFEQGCRTYLTKNPRQARNYFDQIDLDSGEKKSKEDLIRAFIQERKRWIKA